MLLRLDIGLGEGGAGEERLTGCYLLVPVSPSLVPPCRLAQCFVANADGDDGEEGEE